MKKDVSILIVHYNTPKLLRQTLKGIFAHPSNVSFEVIVVDNNPRMRVQDMIRAEFPQVQVLVSEKNLGFGGGMNWAMKHAGGRFFFVFNPDVTMTEPVLETLVAFMEKHPDVGMVAPRLLNPDKTIQSNCYRFVGPEMVLYRRIPFMTMFPFVKRAVDWYLMKDWDHADVRDVDYVLGAAMFVRREAYEAVGGFDPAFFIYYEDQDWCRRFWKAGWRVVYNPAVELIHYHRRETAEGGFFAQLTNPLTHKQMKSAIYYYKKYQGEAHPREAKK